MTSSRATFAASAGKSANPVDSGSPRTAAPDRPTSFGLLILAMAIPVVIGACSSPTTATGTLTIGGAATLNDNTPVAQLTATAMSPKSQDVTSQATWQSSNTAVATVSTGGLVTAVSVGSTTVTASYQGQSGLVPITVAADGDCSSYNPATLGLLLNPSLTPAFYSVTEPFMSGVELLAAGDTQIDGNNLLTVFQSATALCNVGRNNSRLNRLAYILNYFKGVNGQQASVTPADCVAYAPSSLQTVNDGASGWAVTFGSTQLYLLDTQFEANEVRLVAQGYSSLCYIGRGNTRPNYYDFVTEYWK